MIAPGDDNLVSIFDVACNVHVVFATDWRSSFFQLGRFGRSERKKIDDIQRAETPDLGQANTATNGWIVMLVVGRARIEHDKSDAACAARPVTVKTVAVFACAVENGRRASPR